MQPKLFDRVLQEMDHHSFRVVVLYHGGEPFVNKHFLSMLDRTRAQGIPFIKTVTNGMLLTEDISRGLIKRGLNLLEVSLDGTGPTVNDFVRRKCDAARVIENVRRLITLKEEMDARQPAISVAAHQFIDPKTWDRNAAGPEPPQWLQNEFGNAVEFNCHHIMRWPHMNVDDELFDVYLDPEDSDDRNECDHVESTITVRANGDVVPCCFDLTSRMVMGNIQKNSLEEIWNSGRYRRLRENIRARTFNPTCANCNVVRRHAYLTPKDLRLRS